MEGMGRQMKSNINLHIHTTHSDGGNTPAEIIPMLKAAGITTFAITDHDTIDGNIETAVLAKKHRLTHINGVELSCCFSDGEIGQDASCTVHILGYGFNLELMQGELAKLKAHKQKQINDLFSLLVSDGYSLNIENIAHDGKIPARKFIANELIGNGYATSRDDCYKNILYTSRYIPFANCKPSIKKGIEIIHACGGLAIWAHPFDVTRGGKKPLSHDQVYKLLQKLREYAIDGMEVYYQKYTPEQINWLDNLAETFKLYKTIGTDYHNFYKDTKETDVLAFDIVMPDARIAVGRGWARTP